MYVDTNICVITGRVDCKERSCELHYMDAPIDFGNGPIEMSAKEMESTKAFRWFENALSVTPIKRDYLD